MMTHLPSTSQERRLTLAELPPEIYKAQDDPLLTMKPSDELTYFQRVYALLNLLDEWLRTYSDRPPAGSPPTDHPSGEILVERLTQLLQAYKLDKKEWPLLGQLVLLGFHEKLKELLTTHPKSVALFETAVVLTRLSLICGLVSRPLNALGKFDADRIFDLLNRQSVILVDVDQATAAPMAKVELVREAKVADLHVVRREWACYIPSEVANIRNMMAGETFKQTLKNIREVETTNITVSERRQQTEQEDQSKLDSELSQEVNSQLAISVNGHFDVSAAYKTPMTTTTISAGADAGFSIERGERHAAKIARESVSRAVSRVDAMTRESRTRRELMRTEDTNEYSIANGGSNLHAIYRWVDRVDRYQMFRYPDRLLLEFQLPEPAEFYRWRAKQQRAKLEAVARPPEWKVTKEEIKPENLLELATKYHASNLPTLPDDQITIARTVTVELSAENLPKDGASVWNLPPASKEVEIPIPTDYAAVSLTYSGQGSPIWGKWRIGSKTTSVDIEGFHSAFAVIGVGNKAEVNWVGGFRYNSDPPVADQFDWLSSYGTLTDIGSAETWQTRPLKANEHTQVYAIPYGRAMLVIGTDTNSDLQPDPSASIQFNPGAVGTVKAAVNTTGLASCIVTFQVTCKRTNQALMEWQLNVYDALYAAWSQWNDEWGAAQNRQTVLGIAGADAGSSLRNEQIIREELKRQAITWLLDESPFQGRPALLQRPKDGKGNDTDWGDINIAQTRTDAIIIQFLEQAFEWTNMTFIFYPYYWAARANWETLSNIQANDPEFERFLQAGSARAIVPARPGFTDAVQNWLLYQVPYISGQLPTIDDPLYISIDKEIRELTSPWEGGIAGDNWESRVSTTLLYLDTEEELPITNSNGQLPAKAGVPFEPKSICSP